MTAPTRIRGASDDDGPPDLSGTGLAFSRAEYAARLQRLRAAMAEHDIDVLLLSRPESMCWLTGYSARWYRHGGPPEWVGLVTVVVRIEDGALWHVDFAGEEDMIALTSICTDVCILPESTATRKQFVRELKARGLLRGVVGREMRGCLPDHLTAAALEADIRASGAEVVDCTSAVDRLLHIKSPAEMACVAEAARVCDVGVRAAQSIVTPGMTELELWAEMVRAMVTAGGEPAALHEMVSSGPQFLPHIISRRRPIQSGDLVSVDPCGVVNRYHANVARTIAVGEPDESALAASRAAGLLMKSFADAARPPLPVATVGRVIRRHLKEVGLWELRYFFGGYDLGIAFPPDWVGPWFFDLDEPDTGKLFEPGMVTNLEAIAGPFALVDTVAYEQDGSRLLSSIPREILQAGV